MLILTRKPGESLYIGDDVKVTIVEIKGNQIRVGIDAPADLRIYREEIYKQILEENKSAAEAVMSGSALEQLTGTWKGVGREGAPGGAREKAPRTSGLSSLSTRQPQPQVLMKRKKRSRFDEDQEDEKQVPPHTEGEQES
jgi:carbon storage regulator